MKSTKFSIQNSSDRSKFKELISPDLDIWPKFSPKLSIGVLASGSGTNFEAIIKNINSNKLDAEIKLLIVNKTNSGAIEKAKFYNIPFMVIDHRNFSSRENYDKFLVKQFIKLKVEGIVMAGWMRIITTILINEYPQRIINLHPSILPSYKGINAIEKCIASGALITGCTTHYVNLDIDSGHFIAQAALAIGQNEDKDKLQVRIRKLEHKILPMSIALAGLDWREASISRDK